MTKGAKRSGALVAEAVLWCGAAGSGAPRKGDLRIPGVAEEADVVGGKTASVTWAGTAHPVSAALTVMREMTVLANRH